MKKSHKIIYWIATGFLSLGMLAGGVQQLLQIGGYIDIVAHVLFIHFRMLEDPGRDRHPCSKISFAQRMGLCRHVLCHVRSSGITHCHETSFHRNCPFINIVNSYCNFMVF